MKGHDMRYVRPVSKYPRIPGRCESSLMPPVPAWWTRFVDWLVIEVSKVLGKEVQ